MVSSGWEEKQLKDLIKSLDAGVSVNSEDDGNDTADYKILKTSCVSSGTFIPSQVKSVTLDIEVSRLKEPIISDSIIISRMNTPALVGANGYIECAPENTYLPDRLWQVKPKKGVIVMRWLGYWFASSHTRHLLSNLATGTSGSMKNITKLDVLNTKIKTPPFSEQKKIAAILSSWDQAITTTEQLLANSQQQKKALMQQLLTAKKRLHDHNGQPFTGEWITRKLGEIGDIKSAGVDKKMVDGEIPVRLLNFTDVFRRNFIYSNELDHWVTAPETKVKNCDVRKGDVFFTPSSETRGEIGISSVAAEDIPECCYSYHIIRFRIKEQWDLNYKAYAFSSDKFRKQAYRLGDGSGQRYVISQDGFRSIEIRYPDYEEQVAIGKVLKNSEDIIQALKQKLDHLKQEKKALMQQLLTGKRRVKVETG